MTGFTSPDSSMVIDLGKMLLHPNFGELPQWAVVGDTFPVGCALDEDIVHYKYLKENPDYLNPEFNTRLGCGMENVLMSWGHDDYMYMVLRIVTLIHIIHKAPRQEPRQGSHGWVLDTTRIMIISVFGSFAVIVKVWV